MSKMYIWIEMLYASSMSGISCNPGCFLMTFFFFFAPTRIRQLELKKQCVELLKSRVWSPDSSEVLDVNPKNTTPTLYFWQSPAEPWSPRTDEVFSN